MEKIALGILKMARTVKFKKAVVDKLLASTSQPSPGFNMKDFLFEIERLWSIGAESIDVYSDTAGFETLNQLHIKKKASFESFKEHYEILGFVLKALFKFCDNPFVTPESADDSSQDWCQHLVNLIKLYFLPNLNRIQYSQLVKYNMMTLISYLRLVIDAFNETVGNLQTRVNLMNILATINTNFYQSYVSSTDPVTNMEVDDDQAKPPKAQDVNFLYFVQNNSQFGFEYWSFLATFVSLIDWFYQYSSLDPEALLGDSKIDFQAIKSFIEETVKETIKITVLSVSRCHVQQLADADPTSAESKKENEWSAALNLKESLENLTKSALLLKNLSSKSDELYRLALVSLIEVLMNTVDSETEKNANNKTINENVVQLLSAFDLKKASLVLIKYFQESQQTFTQNEGRLQNLLINLINLLSWPYEKKFLEKWICAIMSIFAQSFKLFNLLITVCELKVEYVLKLILKRETRSSAINIFTFFIINYQHSPKLFHKCCPRLFRILIKLKPIVKTDNENKKIDLNSESDQQSYQHLALLSFYCITKFQGYPQIYKSILEVIQNDVNTISLLQFETTKDQYLIGNVSMEMATFGTNEGDSNEVYSSEDLVINKKTRPNLTGLSNLGNTCYLNAIVQSLYSCKRFVASILQCDDNSPAQRSILFQLKVLFATMHLTKRPFIRATNFVKNCTPEWFRLGQQQDSSEFLMFILDNLHEKLKSTLNDSKPNSSKQPTLIQQSFGIQLTTECQCSNCNTKTSRADVCFYLPLSFDSSTDSSKKEQKASLQSLIDNFFKEEKLSSENDNSYSCSQCKSLQSATKRVFFTRDDDRKVLPPDHLILTLNRFIYQAAKPAEDSTSSTSASPSVSNLKIMDELDYPSTISVNTWNSSTGQSIEETYSLISIVIHSGSSLHYGHYYSYITNKNIDESGQLKSEWLCANDSQITETSLETLMKNQTVFKDDTPYVLFYRRDAVKDSEIDLSALPIGKYFTDLIEQDNRVFLLEERASQLKRQKNKKPEMDSGSSSSKYFYPSKDDDDQSGGSQSPPSHCNNDSQRDSGPRIVF